MTSNGSKSEEIKTRVLQKWFPPEEEDENVPTPRYGHSAIADHPKGRMIVFGGVCQGSYLNDIHVYDLGKLHVLHACFTAEFILFSSQIDLS